MNQCQSCRFYKPQYHRVGVCDRQFAADAKMWVEDGKRIFVSSSHVCDQFESPAAQEKDTL